MNEEVKDVSAELDQWMPIPTFCKKHPQFKPGMINYFCRPDVRKRSGFDKVIRQPSPRSRLIHEGRFLAWIEEQGGVA